jgi:hypothetical protein
MIKLKKPLSITPFYSKISKIGIFTEGVPTNDTAILLLTQLT